MQIIRHEQRDGKEIAVYYVGPVKLLKAAKEAGDKQYFPDSVCKNGHLARRYTANSYCTACQAKEKPASETAKAPLPPPDKPRITYPPMELIKHYHDKGTAIAVYYDGPVVSRPEAVEKKLPRYFNMLACKYGHISQRGTSNSACLACSNKKPPGAETYAIEAAHKLETAPEHEKQQAEFEHKPPAETETPPPETPSPYATAHMTAANVIRSVLASIGPKGVTFDGISNLAGAIMGSKFSKPNMYPAINAIRKKGHVEKIFPDDRFSPIKPTKKFFDELGHYEDLYCAINPRRAEQIKANFNGKPPEAAPEQAPEPKLPPIMSMPDLTEGSPMAVIGRGIWEYMEALRLAARAPKGYAEIKHRMDNMRIDLVHTQERAIALDTKLKRSVDEVNGLKRGMHEKDVEISKLKNEIEKLDGIVNYRSGSLKLKDVAKIRTAVDGSGDRH